LLVRAAVVTFAARAAGFVVAALVGAFAGAFFAVVFGATVFAAALALAGAAFLGVAVFGVADGMMTFPVNFIAKIRGLPLPYFHMGAYAPLLKPNH
jgi:hypothetical protein